MKKNRIFKLLLVSILLLIVISDVKVADAKTKIYIANDEYDSLKKCNLKIGESKRLFLVKEKVTSKDENTSTIKNKQIKWSSSKKSVVTVNKSGKIIAKKKGTAKITAKYKKKKYKCSIVVKKTAQVGSSSSDDTTTKQPNKVVTDESTGTTSTTPTKPTTPTATPSGRLNVSSKSIDLTQTVQLSLSGATVESWSSSDDSIATVKNGLVTPLEIGSVKILCRDTNGFEYSCNITIGYPDITLKADSIYTKSIGGTIYYGIDFIVANNCDYDIQFGGKDTMTDDDSTVIYFYQYGFNQGLTGAFFLAESSPFNVSGNQNPTITCQKGYATTVYAFEGKTRRVPSASSNFLWTVTINGKKYAMVTDFYGEIVAMVLWGESDI
ncbi:MAG: Ig-like domain-containing protein [Lachnospiraceae bacterium]|nr:Ig-like domain-containing protein [Lachnospiraceae bacterium]